MPLIVQPDGTVAEGAIPVGGTKVLVLFDGQIQEAFVSQDAPVSTGEVNREQVRYDLPEIVPNQTAKDSLIPFVSESIPALTEEVVAALLARAEEVVPDQTEVIRISVGANANESVPALDEDTAAAILVQTEFVPTILDNLYLRLSTDESVLTPIEDAKVTATATANESIPTLEDQIEAAIVVISENVPTQTEEIVIQTSLNGYANQNVQTTTWTNPANALGNTTGTSASLTATASGLAGTTNNTATGILALGFRDVNLGDLTITSVVLNVENSGAVAGVPIAQPTVNIDYQYSLNNGSSWNTFYTHNTTALAKGIRSVDITSIVGQDQSLLSALQIRATGSVTSGTGLGVSYTASFFRAWMVVSANRTYT